MNNSIQVYIMSWKCTYKRPEWESTSIERFNMQIDHFRDIPMDSQTTDIKHFAVVFQFDVTIKAL